MSSRDWHKAVIRRLQTKIAPHRNYKQARARLNSALLVRQPGECLCLTGPSRGGKTTITEDVEALHNPTGARDRLAERPVVVIRVRNKGDKGHFTTKTFYIGALRAISHPFFRLTGNDLFANADLIRRMHNESNDTLADILENALEVLGVKYLIIDEAQHFLYMPGREKTACQILESLKTLAETIGCVIVFVGAYPILDVLRLAPHILGREYLIHMPRYRLDSERDLVAFEQTLQWFSKGIEFQRGVTSLRDWNQRLLEGSCGVAGLVSAWVRDAISEMLSRGEDRLHLNHICYSQKGAKDRAQILAEIEAGELSIAGWEYPERRSDSTASEPREQTAAVTRKPKPFQSKPRRYEKGGRG